MDARTTAKKIDKCYSFSKSVISSYKILENIIASGMRNDACFDTTLRSFSRLVIKERNAYNDLSYEEIITADTSRYASNIPSEELITSEARFNFGLQNASEILTTGGFKINEIISVPTNIPSYFTFGISDIICAMPELEILKIMEMLILEMLNDPNSNKDYVQALYRMHVNYVMHYSSLRRTTEMIAIDCKFEVSKFPTIDYRNFLKQMNKKFNNGGILYNEHIFGSGFIDMALLSLNILSSLELKDNDIESYYQLMFYSTAIEVYMSYLNRAQFEELVNRIKKTTIKDSKVKKKINELLSKKKH